MHIAYAYVDNLNAVQTVQYAAFLTLRLHMCVCACVCFGLSVFERERKKNRTDSEYAISAYHTHSIQLTFHFFVANSISFTRSALLHFSFYLSLFICLFSSAFRQK